MSVPQALLSNNGGSIIFNSNGTSCNDTADILIRSSNTSGVVGTTQRTWTGTGTFSMTDVDVRNQVAGSGITPVPPIILYSGVNSGNNPRWTFNNTCIGPYTWIGGPNQSWVVSTNWSPVRPTAAALSTTDVLIFDGAVTPSPIVNNVPTQTNLAMRLTNNVAPVTLNAATGGATLTLNGATSIDLDVPGGTQLYLAGADPLVISLTAAGHECTVAGQILMENGAHQLLGANAGEITMTGTNAFTTDSTYNSSTHPFGTGTSGSVLFQSGATGAFHAGLDPFGGTGKSVVTFDLGSFAKFFTTSAFDPDGRSYGYLTLDGSKDYSGGSATHELLVRNNFELETGSSFTLSNTSGGDLNLHGGFEDQNSADGKFVPNGRAVKFQGTGTQTIYKPSGIESFFDVLINQTAPGDKVQLYDSPFTLTINGQLNLSTADSLLELQGKTLALNGTVTGSGNLNGDAGATLNIGGTGALGTLNFVSGSRTLSAMTMNRTSSGAATLGNDLTIGASLTLTNGIVNVGTNTLSLDSAATASRTNGYVVGNLKKTFGATGTFTFPVGTGSSGNAYSPVDANLTAGTDNSLTVKAAAGQEPHVSGNALQRYWTLANSGSITANLTFHYLAGDVVGSESIYKIFKYDTSLHQFTPDLLNTTSHFATLNNVSSFSNWTLAEGCETPPSGLTSWWPGDGKAIDVQGVYNGILRNGATFATGKVGQAFSFDGVDDFVKLPDNFFPYPTSGTSTTAFTCDAWFKTATTGVILGQQVTDPFTNPGSYVPGLYVGTDHKLHASIFYGNNTNTLTSSANVDDNVFHHVAVTYDGTTQTLYLDGANAGSRAHTQFAYSTFYKYQLGTGFTNGWPNTSGGWSNFNGLIDEVELFNRVLTSTEVLNLFNQGSLGKCKPTDIDGDGVPDIHDICPATGVGVTVTDDGCDATACVTPPANLVAWWAADGNAKDLQGAHDGTLVNGTTFNAGEVGPAFVFDGVDDRVTTTLDVQPSAMATTTWDAWVYPTRNNGTRQTIMSSDDGGLDREVTQESGNFGVFTGSSVWIPISADLNQWQHIAVVYTPTNVLFYKNGVEYSFGSAPTGGGTTNKFTLGMNLCCGIVEPFQGRIDEVEVFNAQVSASDIQRIYNIGSVGKCKGTQPPNVGYILRADANPSGAASVHFTVVFTKSVTGVDAADFVVSTSGSLLNATVTNVTGSGTTYTVTVGNYTGSGALRLDVIDDDSITDGTTPLGGAGTGNGNFTAGESYTINGADITTPFVVTKTADTNDGINPLFPQTSDEFFARNDVGAELGGLPVDLAFIDGMHHFEFALRDCRFGKRRAHFFAHRDAEAALRFLRQ